MHTKVCPDMTIATIAFATTGALCLSAVVEVGIGVGYNEIRVIYGK